MTDTTTASPALMPFTTRQEGRVHKAYRDSGGVITIGIGFTGLSKVFSNWWMEHRGHTLKLGDTITDVECDLLLGKLIEAEYAPPVARRFAGTGIKQHEFDAATDMSFNCGPGALKWTWATALAARKLADAAARLKKTAITAAGKTLTGLVRRRADEAVLMLSGDYGSGAASVASGRAEVKAYQQQLTELGLYKGFIDGQAGKGSLTEGAVMNFQRANGMVVDGVVGPATRAALARAVEARQATQAGTGSVATGAAAGGGTEAAQQGGALDWNTILTAGKWAAIILVVAVVLYLAWRNRGVILRKRTPA